MCLCLDTSALSLLKVICACSYRRSTTKILTLTESRITVCKLHTDKDIETFNDLTPSCNTIIQRFVDITSLNFERKGDLSTDYRSIPSLFTICTCAALKILLCQILKNYDGSGHSPIIRTIILELENSRLSGGRSGCF